MESRTLTPIKAAISSREMAREKSMSSMACCAVSLSSSRSTKSKLVISDRVRWPARRSMISRKAKMARLLNNESMVISVLRVSIAPNRNVHQGSGSSGEEELTELVLHRALQSDPCCAETGLERLVEDAHVHRFAGQCAELVDLAPCA